MKYLLCFFSFLLTAPVFAQQFEFQPYSLPEDGRLVILVEEESLLAGPAGNLDAVTAGSLTRAMAEADFTGKVKSTLTLYGFAGYARVDLVGAGKKGVDRNLAEDLGGVAANLLKDVKGGSIQVLWDLPGLAAEVSAARFAFGYLLRSYRFDRYQEDQRDPGELPLVQVYSKTDAGDEFANDLMHIADGVFFARDVSSEPANVMYPQAFVDRVKTEFKGLDNVRIRVLDEKDLQRLNMGAHWGVGKGSSRPPRLLIIEYMGGGDSGLVALAGKGITFDTGGISLKRNDGMWAMKGDLGGAGVVTGTVLSAARRGAKVNVVALAALAENMPSGTATRPGDVLTTMSGKTVEIRSTDAEGRLVLSDAVHYAQETYAPAVLIDVATLTGSVGRALGDDYAGIFGRHQGLIDDIAAASQAANEAVWQLPLDDTHFKQIESDYADIKNSGAGSPGASVGAAFIGSFVEEAQVWVHLDIAGVDLLDKARPTVPKGYSGWGVRTLDEYLRRYAADD